VSALAWIGFLVAAAIGAPARYLLDGFVQDRTRGAFPFGTFTVNLSGSFLLGLLTGLGLYHGAGSTLRTIIGTGGLGAFTTFSTFSFETVRLAEEGAPADAATNALGSLVVCAMAAAAGLALAAAL
jgi:CrcB protein